MEEILEEQLKKPRCLLVAWPGDNLFELKGLVYTLGMEISDCFWLNKVDIQPAYGMGSGKAEEICAHAKAVDSDCIIMDFELDPTKQRNWEKLCHLPVFDRQEVILRIFAERALTKEAVLQVELARLEYSLPRLSHMYGDLARQRGGSYGSKGSGETQLELDRRGVRERIHLLKKELDKVIQNRDTQRKRREKTNIRKVALCGYTNAGKSSLLNALTSSEAFVENKLFATLDPLTRKLFLSNPDYETTEDFSKGPVSKGHEILLTDTVGFISNLPHSLVNAFRSTLEEAAYADLLLIVLDSSDPNVFLHYETIKDVLKEISADEHEVIIVLNKIDFYNDKGSCNTGIPLPEGITPDENISSETNISSDTREITADQFTLTKLENQFPSHIKVSTKTGFGLEELKKELYKKLFR